MKPLSELKKGEFGYIVDLRCGATCLEVLNNGVFPGDEIKVLENNPAHAEMLISNRWMEFKINKQKATTIITNLISYEINLN